MQIEYDRVDSRLIGELGLLLLIPVVLVLIHLIVPRTVADEFYFYPWRPTAVSALTAAVLHSSWRHVTSNAVAFGATILPIFAIYHRWGRRRTMWFLVVLLLVSTPLTKYVSNVLLLRDYFGVVGPATNTKGFSGIASAFVGMLLASVGFYVNDRTRTTAGYWVILGAIYCGLGVLVILYSLPPSRLLVSIAALAVGFGLIIHQFQSEFNSDSLGSPIQIIKSADLDFELVLISVAFVVVFMVGMFPSDISSSGTNTNIVAHFIGLLFGFSVTLLALQIN